MPPAFRGGPTLGSKPPLTPKWKFSTSLHYTADFGDLGAVTPRIDYTYQSKIFNDVNNTSNAAQDGYSVFNARITWQSADGNWTSALAVNNLMDRLYYIGKYSNISTYGTLEAQPAQPRTFFFTVKRSF